MSDEVQPPIDGDPALVADPDAEVDAATIATDDGKGNKTVPLSAHIGAKKELREAQRRIKELEPVAQRVKEVNDRLNSAQPIIDAVITNPQLRAEALRLAGGGGTRPSGFGTAQPADDDEARGHAEDYNMYLSDGITPDTARARRALDRIAGITKRQTDDAMRPLASLTLTDKGQQNLQRVEHMTDEDGAPLATRESISEVAKMLPPQLLANPDVVNLVATLAIGIDHQKRRTPKASEEPLYLERQGGGRRSEPSISPEEKRQLERFGISEKDYAASSKRLEQGANSRKGIVLGS